MSHQPPQQAPPPGLPELLSNLYHDLEVLRTYLSIAFTTTDFISKDLHRLTRTIVNISPTDFERFLRNN